MTGGCSLDGLLCAVVRWLLATYLCLASLVACNPHCGGQMDKVQNKCCSFDVSTCLNVSDLTVTQ